MRPTSLSTILLSCTIATAANAEDAPAPQNPAPDDRPVIYIVRTSAMAYGAVPAIFLIDGEKVASVGSGGCAAVRATVGFHTIIEKWFSIPLLFGPTFTKPVGIRASWAPGQSYYYQLETHLLFGSPERVEWRITALDPEIGAPLVAGRTCRPPP